jgi:hypothetical protein
MTDNGMPAMHSIDDDDGDDDDCVQVRTSKQSALPSSGDAIPRLAPADTVGELKIGREFRPKPV